MPFRLLALALDPEQAGEICGKTFSRYAADGTEITLVCITAAGADGRLIRQRVRGLGVQQLVLLDYQPEELHVDWLQTALIDLMQAIRPHVVVSGADSDLVKQAAAHAFLAVRRRQGGSAALPAKLYYRSAAVPVAELTTAISVQDGTREVFARAHPRPWVTGILESDLFSGLASPVAAPERPAA